jgi:DNA polymerase-3 subunit beta
MGEWQEADMRLRVDRDALGEAVAFVSRVLPSRPVVPLLSGMLIEADHDGLTISCFDYEVSARCRVAAEVVEPGTALVPGRLLAEITRSLPSRPIEFSVDADTLNLVCGSAEFGLVCLPVQDYPALPSSPEPVGVVAGGLFAVAVAQVASSASRDDTLPMLTAVCVDIEGETLTLAATDRYRLAARKAAFTPFDPDVKAVVLVPARIMTEAARALGGAAPVTLAFNAGSDGLISFQAADRRLTARLIGGEFIKYESRLAGEFDCYADLPAAPVIEAVRRASLVADRAGPVRLTFGEGRLVIEAHAEGRARAAETVPADFTGDQSVISFNPHYLLDGLVAAAAVGSSGVGSSGVGSSGVGSSAGGSSAVGSSAGGSSAGGLSAVGSSAASALDEPGDSSPSSAPAEPGKIRLEFNSPAKPALITWTDDSSAPRQDPAADPPDFRYLLVPLRVPDRA